MTSNVGYRQLNWARWGIKGVNTIRDATDTGDATIRTNEGVDLGNCPDTGGGYNVGWTKAGEWIKYSVNVASTGLYTMNLRLASGGGNSKVTLTFDMFWLHRKIAPTPPSPRGTPGVNA